MDDLEFIFSLFGLLLGLALAEALAGLARALKSKHRVKIGWPTALLGLLVSSDVVTFWMFGWQLREGLKVSWPLMFAGFIVTGIYYVSAALIFPDDEGEDFDAHFERVRRLVLGGVVLCNAALFAFTVSLIGVEPLVNLRAAIISWSLFPVAITAALIKDRRIVIACLIWLITLYPLSVVWA
ncbi:MAG: hypothetical protein ABL914_12190 [Novosphingobium sp.]|uniref:hypothetical protein n=1 Tax=Novosphingobium sp. TaxID=1874826 RepID=UPI0032BC1528